MISNFRVGRGVQKTSNILFQRQIIIQSYEISDKSGGSKIAKIYIYSTWISPIRTLSQFQVLERSESTLYCSPNDYITVVRGGSISQKRVLKWSISNYGLYEVFMASLYCNAFCELDFYSFTFCS